MNVFEIISLLFISFSVEFLFHRARAEGVKDIANNTKQALNASEDAAKKARKALHDIRINLNTTRIAEVRAKKRTGWTWMI